MSDAAMSDPAMSDAAAPILYVLGYYPKAAQTFIGVEIGALTTRGVSIVPVAMNQPADSDLLTADARAEHDRTFYVKAQPKAAIARAVMHALRASPTGFVRTLLTAWRTARTDLRQLLWWTFYFVEAIVVWDYATKIGSRRLHSHFAYPGSNVAWLVADFGNRVAPDEWTWLLTIHGVHDFYNQDEVALDRKAVSADAIICISDSIRAQVLRQLDPALWPKVIVRRCGIVLTAFEQRPVREQGTPPVVLTVARLSSEKGHLVLIDAAARLRARGVDVTVEIVGDGPLRDAINERVATLGLRDAVRMVGELAPQDVSKHLAQADVFCLPSFAEGVPISIMEAMAVGVPVVATSVGGVGELVEDGVTGGLVAPGRDDQLADALAAMLTDADRRARIVTAARQRVAERHDLATNIVELVPLVTGAMTGAVTGAARSARSLRSVGAIEP